jgi:hypothetical protein
VFPGARLRPGPGGISLIRRGSGGRSSGTWGVLCRWPKQVKVSPRKPPIRAPTSFSHYCEEPDLFSRTLSCQADSSPDLAPESRECEDHPRGLESECRKGDLSSARCREGKRTPAVDRFRSDRLLGRRGGRRQAERRDGVQVAASPRRAAWAGLIGDR